MEQQYRVRRRSGAERALPYSYLEPLSDALVHRFLLRAGFRVSTARAIAHTRKHMYALLQKLLDAMRELMVLDHRLRFMLVDVVNACRVLGIRLYGYDDVCELDYSGAAVVYHVTEMVESNTAFGGPEQWDDEPDVEPGACYTRTDFVANYTARLTEESDESDDDVVSEWSWYGESDADSDSGSADDEDGDSNVFDEEDVEMDGENSSSSSKRKPWQQPQRQYRDTFVSGLLAAQTIVDDQLLCTDGSGDEGESADEDAPQGQGYDSDFGGKTAPVASRQHAVAVAFEDEMWGMANNNIRAVDDSDAERVLEALQQDDDVEQYVMSRQVFGALLHGLMDRYDVEISSVGLSALHNAAEQQLHRALTDGVLSHELRAMIRDEQTAQQHELHAAVCAELRAEREKVQERDRTLADLTAAFKAKELAMQQQIAALQDQLVVQQQQHSSNDDIQMQAPTITPAKRKASPGKRKAIDTSTHDEVMRVSPSDKSSSGAAHSLVGSLQSKIQDYATRSKKARVNPV